MARLQVDIGLTWPRLTDGGEVVFPMSVEMLDGRRILLILVSSETPDAAFVPGVATWSTSDGLLVAPALGGPPVRVEGSREALRGFDPTVLPRLIVPEYRAAALELARGVEACVAAFGDTSPPGAAKYRDAFVGLAGNAATGEVFLSLASEDEEHDDD